MLRYLVVLLITCYILHPPLSIPGSHAATINLPQTGQTTCYNAGGTVIPCSGTGQDGDKLLGVPWPIPRFTDNVNGTVTDNLTGLIWLKNANCFGYRNWASALTAANTLASGACGLSDGSTAGQWRLPTRRELYSLVDLSLAGPALPAGHPFNGVTSGDYWSSSTSVNFTDAAWVVRMTNGLVYDISKIYSSSPVWPVRAGQ